MIKKLTAIFTAMILILSVPTVASAEINRQEITDALFESEWESWLEGQYYLYTKSTVKIENNPLAAMYYMTMEAFVDGCDDELLQLLVDGKENPRNFLRLYYEDWDYQATKKKNSYFSDSMIWGVDIGIVDYQYGIWELVDINDNTIYGRFIEDETTFTLIDNETEEVLGVYNKLIGYEYLEDSGYDAGGTGAGGSGAANGSTSNSSNATSSNTGDSTYSETSNPNIRPNVRENPSTVVSSVKPNGGYTSVYDTDNPAVTPEIASAVDAAKSANNNTNVEVENAEVETPSEEENNTGRNVIILVIVLLAIAAVAFYLAKNKNKKGENKNGNDTN